MKIALIGASGFVGSAILKEALDRNHQVVAIVRNPKNITTENENLIVKQGDILDEQTVENLVKNCDVVVSAHNPGWNNPDMYNEFLNGSKSIQQGSKKGGVKRYFVIGGAGSLEVAPGVQAVDLPDFPAEAKLIASAERDYFNILKETRELNWTLFNPAFEMHQVTSGVRKGTYRLGLDNPVFDENSRSILSVEDLAMVIIDELEEPKHERQRFTAAY